MKRIKIMSDVELSYLELKGLETHFKQAKRDAVVNSIKNKSALTLELLRKMIDELKEADELSPTRTKT